MREGLYISISIVAAYEGVQKGEEHGQCLCVQLFNLSTQAGVYTVCTSSRILYKYTAPMKQYCSKGVELCEDVTRHNVLSSFRAPPSREFGSKKAYCKQGSDICEACGRKTAQQTPKKDETKRFGKGKRQYIDRSGWKVNMRCLLSDRRVVVLLAKASFNDEFRYDVFER